MTLKIYNTLSRSVENFIPINPPHVAMYSCGPTVYDYQHIGHMRRYVGDDLLVRVLKLNKYDVKHVMNITDVGHLVSDSDTGEDKMEKGAKKFGMSVWDIAKKFEKQFIDSCKELHIPLPENKELMHATDFIKEQIALVKQLEQKGFTYKIADGIYFDTSKSKNYFKLSRQNPQDLKAGARVDMIEGKRSPMDFALWKFSPVDTKRAMEWESPWGIGFPGWHIECSAMSLKALTNAFDPFGKLRGDGKKNYTIDIHTGGIDHINIHHTNEIAQAEAATGKPFVKYWVHHAFLMVEGEKMSKSIGNIYTVQDIIDKGYDPLSLRYLYLQTHYRQEMNFTWESLEAAQTALERLRAFIEGVEKVEKVEKVETRSEFEQKFLDAINDDLNLPKALATVWELVKTDIADDKKLQIVMKMDKVLGLQLINSESRVQNSELEIPAIVKELLAEREEARKQKDFKKSDKLREKVKELGYEVMDAEEETKIRKLKNK